MGPEEVSVKSEPAAHRTSSSRANLLAGGGNSSAAAVALPLMSSLRAAEVSGAAGSTRGDGADDVAPP